MQYTFFLHHSPNVMVENMMMDLHVFEGLISQSQEFQKMQTSSLIKKKLSEVKGLENLANKPENTEKILAQIFRTPSYNLQEPTKNMIFLTQEFLSLTVDEFFNKYILFKDKTSMEISSLLSENPIPIIIEVSNEKFFNKLNSKLFRKSDGEKVIIDFRSIFTKVLHYYKKLGQEYHFTFYTKSLGKIYLFNHIEAKPVIGVSQGGQSNIPLLPEIKWAYALVPSFISIYTESDESKLSNDQLETIVKLQLKPQGNLVDKITDNDMKKYKRFIKMLKYFQDIPYPMLKTKTIEKAISATTQESFVGIDEFMARFKRELLQFTTTCYSTPKGILLYGPPGTGKSAITGKLCQELEVIYPTKPMAAGDLKKGIVGDSEKTIDAISGRCKMIPWEMCVLLIDEIDSLAPDRTSNSNTNNQDLLGVLLATLDGSKVTRNLKIIASTNLLNKMDSAFLRRMEIQLFLGNPGTEARSKWIDEKAKAALHQDFYFRIHYIKSKEQFVKILIESSLNFSADGYRKLIERYYQSILNPNWNPKINNDQTLDQFLKQVNQNQKQNEKQEIEKAVLDEFIKLLIQKVREVSIENKIAIGSQFIIDILEQRKEEEEKFLRKKGNSLINKEDMESFLELAQRTSKESQYAKRELIEHPEFNEFQTQFLEFLEQQDNQNVEPRLFILAVKVFQNEIKLREAPNQEVINRIIQHKIIDSIFQKVFKIDQTSTINIYEIKPQIIEFCDPDVLPLGEMDLNFPKLLQDLIHFFRPFKSRQQITDMKFLFDLSTSIPEEIIQTRQRNFPSYKNNLVIWKLLKNVEKRSSNGILRFVILSAYFPLIELHFDDRVNSLKQDINIWLAKTFPDIFELKMDLLYQIEALNISHLIKALHQYKYIFEQKDETWDYFCYQYEEIAKREFYKPTNLRTFNIIPELKIMKENWLSLIVQFAQSFNSDMLFLIDNNTLIQNSANDDNQACLYISNLVQEAQKYTRSVVIFDLDSILLTKRDYSSIKQELTKATRFDLESGKNAASFTYQYQRPHTFYTILDILKKASRKSQIWYFIVASNPKIIVDYRDGLEWPPTNSIIAYELVEADKDTWYRCLYCDEVFSERKNENEFKCYRHEDKRLYLKSNPKIIKTEKELKELLKRDNEEQRPDRGDYKYFCCGNDFMSKGEKQFRHVKGKRYSDMEYS